MASEETVVITRKEYERFLSQESKISALQHQLSELQRLIFGAKSERFIAPIANQPTLFELPESEKTEKSKEEAEKKKKEAAAKLEPEQAGSDEKKALDEQMRGVARAPAQRRVRRTSAPPRQPRLFR